MDSENPYTSGRREWLERYGSYLQRERIWRYVSFFLLFTNILLVLGFLREIGKSRVVPYVVEVDKLGHAVPVSAVSASSLSDDRITKYVLGEWIRRARAVLADPLVERQWMLFVVHHTAGAARAFVDRYYRNADNNPLRIASKKLVTVEITQLMHKSRRTWYAEWTETTWTVDGQKSSTDKWKGFFTVDVVPPKTASEIRNNPLGQYLTYISWNRAE